MERSFKWVNFIYFKMCQLYKIKKPIPLTYCKVDGVGGAVVLMRSIEATSDGKIVTFNISKYKPIAIELNRSMIEDNFNHMYEDLLLPVILTLIHEIVHYLGYEKHTKAFMNKQYKLTMKWCAYALGRKYKDCLKDKDLIAYVKFNINR